MLKRHLNSLLKTIFMPPKRKHQNNQELPTKKIKVNQAKLLATEETKAEGKGEFDHSPVRIASWNVNGIRAVENKGNFFEFCGREDLDVLCFNETKLQEKNIPEYRKKLPQFPFQYWSCSIAKKGYSGVAILSKVEPVSVKVGIDQKEHDQEGRVLTAEFDSFYVVSTYIPNAGQKLERLKYRVDSWDVDFRNYLKSLDKPFIWLGDLNVVHQEIDIWEIKGKEKLAGCTPEERRSFSETLEEGFVDTFRELHPQEKKFSWYSQRNPVARQKNQGWRLDYIVVSQPLMQRVQDSLIHDNVMGSDHHPVELLLSN